MGAPDRIDSHTDQPPAVIDVEASGFGPDSYPIEVGLVLPDGQRYCALIEPCAQWTHWDPAAQAQHGLSRDLLSSCGKTPRTVARELNSLVGSQTLYSDGWTVDLPWLRKLYAVAGLGMSFRVSAIEMILSESDLAHWDALKQRTAFRLGAVRHRASNDAQLIQETWLAVKALPAH